MLERSAKNFLEAFLPLGIGRADPRDILFGADGPFNRKKPALKNPSAIQLTNHRGPPPPSVRQPCS
ncbi:hypothetical protein TDIS_0742 [Thermosulfurimonas dismutans]|uniref:Uncharacterized protein n=1 Tax=Thermosulfurimonas dismutans TaxID=999894 RepID=A0A179D4S5_9BACT|nr:hypothetical protein TDIS_0742 [Thermosulfurimonas dismutans]